MLLSMSFLIMFQGMGATIVDSATPEDDESGTAQITHIDGPIGPATSDYISDAFSTARERQASLIVLLLNTPGGLDKSMRAIIREVLNSPVPVAGFVFPSGARAASAGTYILYACHVAAMAPGTNLGAATPVQIGGGFLPRQPEKNEKDREEQNSSRKAPDSSDAMKSKVINDAVAFIRSLAQLRGRNVDWAEKAVRESVSLPVNEARDKNVIDLVATDVPDLLKKIDGLAVRVDGQSITLKTKNLDTHTIEPGWRNKVLSVITNPNIALILMLVGIYGLIFEFANPGSIGPGVVGIICLLLGLYALNVLPLNYAGLGLLLLGVAFMIVEAFVPSFGVFGIGGIVAFVLGSAILIESDAPGFRLSWTVIGGTAAASGGVLIFLLGYIWRAHRRPVKTGTEEMIGSEAKVLNWSGGEGYVQVHGERWRAKGPNEAHDRVRVREQKGLVLIVEPVTKPEKGTNS
jgi:membrane-bound serine protease (ClpP class)